MIEKRKFKKRQRGPRWRSGASGWCAAESHAL